ncbi:hypothetical protein [Microbispora sp. NPDC049125]|uniref:hypothetical protein n=1 Tax=Microbispora sp. NPDC049125 TaxID=3154929 RepID=UPI0034662441
MTGHLSAYAEWGTDEWAAYARALEPLGRVAVRTATMMTSDVEALRPLERVIVLAGDLTGLPRPPLVPYEAFKRSFQTEPHKIRVLLDWSMLDAHHQAGDVKVTLHIHGSPRDFHDTFAPWYHRDHLHEAEFDDPDARPWRFSEPDAGSRWLSSEHQEKIEHFLHDYRRTEPSQPLRLSLATLDLGDTRALVLDGNHRLAAILRMAMRSHRIRVAEFRLSAPLSRRLLPDLTHWHVG